MLHFALFIYIINFRSLHALFNPERCFLFSKHHSSNIYYPHSLLTLFWLSGHGMLMKGKAQECDNYRFLLWSFITIMSVITSTPLFTFRISQSYFLTYFSFLLKIFNNLTFLPLMLSENIASSLCYNLNFAESSFTFLHPQANIFYMSVQALQRRGHGAVSSFKEGVIISYSLLVSLMPN